ncbi:eukaryotic translation initiation factor 3 subunit I-like [Zingiber officinale]|uniref:eukaryotic translation initiation factor 3 subunit I-like n=1 Tax=Zingiber officinale TaxID=94328 RepID=UPI001C4C1DF7|nr:eukaryotic translation initiation factor 3 subunit I-like [Zingiber officinale]
MRPILMKAHERPLTFLRYNREGDLLFSCAKDHTPNVWFADNGERLGLVDKTYLICLCSGRKLEFVRVETPILTDFSSFLTLDVELIALNLMILGDSMRLITASTDQTVKLWNVQDGDHLYSFDFDSPAKSVDFSVIRVCDTEVYKEIGHQKTITSLSKSAYGSHFLTGSSDKSAKLWDARTLTLLKTYVTECPVNACAISPLLDHVVIGGGQEAVHVTTTDRSAGKFEAKFFHKNLQEEIGGVKGHFGPINALAFNPDGRRNRIGVVKQY